MTNLHNSFLVQSSQPFSTKIQVYVGYEDLTGDTVNLADVNERLAKLNRSEVIRVLALMSMFACRSNYDDIRIRLDVTRAFLSESRYQTFFDHVMKLPFQNGALFHPRQIRLTLQLALMSCKETKTETDDDSLRRELGDICLMTNDVLNQLEPSRQPEKDSDAFNEWFIATTVPITERITGVENISRARAFWLDLPATAAIQSKFASNSQKSFSEAFLLKHGISLPEFHLILFSIFTHFEVHGRDAVPLIHEDPYLTSSFKSNDIRKFLSELSLKPDGFAMKLLSSPRQNMATDSSLLSAYPLIEVFDGKHACPDRSLLHRSLADKIYFMLQKSYDNNAFEQIFGFVFEEYVFGFLRERLYEQGILARTLYVNPRFEGKEAEAGDAIILDNQFAFVIEMKARLLTTRERFSGDQSVLINGIDDIICKSKTKQSKQKKGVAQLADNITRMLAGEKIVAGQGKPLLLTSYKAIIPVIVNYESSINFEAVRRYAEKKFLDCLPASVDREKIGPLLLLSVGDVELLEAVSSQHGMIKMLLDFASQVNGNQKDHSYSFNSFLHAGRYIQSSQYDHSLLYKLQQRAVTEATEELASRTT